MVGYNISDAEVPYFPLFHDKGAIPGKKYFYRVMAVNASGVSKASNIAGPVEVKYQALIDQMRNTGTVLECKNVNPVTGYDRSFKEAIYRISGENGSEITYKVPGKFAKCMIYSFEQENEPSLEILASNDGENWNNISVTQDQYTNKESNYDYRVPKLYSFEGGNEIQFIKIDFAGSAQIARVEILYSE